MANPLAALPLALGDAGDNPFDFGVAERRRAISAVARADQRRG
jgi:hypothetical protein